MNNKTQKILALILAVLMIFSFVSCSAEKEEPRGTEASLTQTREETQSLWDDAVYKEDKTFGSGSKKIEIEVKAEDKSVTFTVLTDKESLADALLEHSLAEGEEGQYGLYIKKVNGILADYDVDATYWSLSKNGEVLMTGASDTAVSDGEHYELTRTKG